MDVFIRSALDQNKKAEPKFEDWLSTPDAQCNINMWIEQYGKDISVEDWLKTDMGRWVEQDWIGNFEN